MDTADLLPPAIEAQLAARIANAEAQSKHQFVVVTVNSLGGKSIEDYGRALGNWWGIGRKGGDDSVLLIVAPNEHKARIEVADGLTKALTDQEAGIIMDDTILPRFRDQHMADGIVAGSNAILREITE
ncbi:TPM domain-containing protein [Sphingomonas psychrotolerans]|uniref:TPM domain-containing protein n=1 Tax=Sphingomonas psychrotolerans TaxID=1327635 RepID=UPI0013051F27|nr:TPM domain-containing protein [Sphingomonas psychrotolerans]